MNSISKESVTFVKINEGNVSQRIDNFLTSKMKGVSKSHIYKIIRDGQIRVNKKRVKFSYKLSLNDLVRIPPTGLKKIKSKRSKVTELNILYEDKYLLVIDKLEGVAVHGGSGISLGLIESLRNSRPNHDFLELIHRIDKDTSGILMIAKKRSFLRYIQEKFRNKQIKKRYVAILSGKVVKKKFTINKPLLVKNRLNGERHVVVDEKGLDSLTNIRLIDQKNNLSKVEIFPKTGRTHQIRVHAASIGHPILGDTKYNLQFEKGVKRLMLHAVEISFYHKFLNNILVIKSELPQDFERLFN